MRNSPALYKDEMKKMKKHRKLYRPMLIRFFNLYKEIKDSGGPLEITGGDEMMLIVELIDLGYLDMDAVQIMKKGYTILKVVYFGKYPLTSSGEKLIEDGAHSSGVKKIINLLGRFFSNPGGRFKL